MDRRIRAAEVAEDKSSRGSRRQVDWDGGDGVVAEGGCGGGVVGAGAIELGGGVVVEGAMVGGWGAGAGARGLAAGLLKWRVRAVGVTVVVLRWCRWRCSGWDSVRKWAHPSATHRRITQVGWGTSTKDECRQVRPGPCDGALCEEEMDMCI